MTPSEEGTKAFLFNNPQIKNPYAEGTPECDQWDTAWKAAYQAKLDERAKRREGK